MRLLLVLIATVLMGCATPPAPPAPLVASGRPLVWSDYRLSRDVQTLWEAEARKRFDDPVVFCCHGGIGIGDGLAFEWVMYPDRPRSALAAAAVARTLHNQYPDRDVVLVVCNPGGFDIDVPRVWYARADVWLIPDADLGIAATREKSRGVGSAGSIWDFVSRGSR